MNMTDLRDFIDVQLQGWPLARANYQALGRTRRRSMVLGDLTVGIQHNPARIVSTGAKTDASSISSRPCFLCKDNRPAEQVGIDIVPGWELLVNPYPIFPTHFTIASKTHQPQAGFQLDMITMAERLPEHTVFFNGSKSGASCPDHLHCQAVKPHELPLMRLIAERHLPEENGYIATAATLGLKMPFDFRSVIITPNALGMELLKNIEVILGREEISSGLINIYVWTDECRRLRIVGVPRRAHRPSCYGDGAEEHLVSPGCIDMAGVIITPLEKDYTGLTAENIEKIYSECGKNPDMR
ncbi:MAG: DUF4922 domain-containing protein [Muribaculaceae bacterium]|nr:DUF4922 domain-containing protein [Muribaculaceae bacterium]